MTGHYRCPSCGKYLNGVDLINFIDCPACGVEAVDMATDSVQREVKKTKKHLDRLVTGSPVVRESESEYLKRKLTEAQERKHEGRTDSKHKRRRSGGVGRKRTVRGGQSARRSSPRSH